MSIYLDNAALEKPKDETLEYIFKIFKNQWYNPNSSYSNGIESRKIIEHTKNLIATEINCTVDELIFCSCGSEANSLATCGYIREHELSHFITSTIEHASILENPYGIKLITVDSQGLYDMNKISSIHDSLVSLQFANSEIGTIQNIKEITNVLHQNNCVVHTDAVAVFGKMKIDVNDLGIDMLSATSQKIGGILGAAFLYKKYDIEIEPMIFGHNTLRGGTANVPAIAALGYAVEHISYHSNPSHNRDYVYNYIVNNIPDSYLVGAPLKHRLPHNLYICFKGVKSEFLMTLMDLNGCNISTGSACNSGSPFPSQTLLAIGMNADDIYSCVRITFNGSETIEELDYFCKKLKENVEILRCFS